MQPLTEQGSDGFANGIRLLVNNPRVQQRRPQGNAVFGAVSGRRSGSYPQAIPDRGTCLDAPHSRQHRPEGRECRSPEGTCERRPAPSPGLRTCATCPQDRPPRTDFPQKSLSLQPVAGCRPPQARPAVPRTLRDPTLARTGMSRRSYGALQSKSGHPAPQNQRFGGEANDARLDKAEIGWCVSGRRTLGFRGPQEPGLDLTRRPQCFGCIFYCSKKTNRKPNQDVVTPSLEHIGFSPHLECWITRCTGQQSRAGDQEFKSWHRIGHH